MVPAAYRALLVYVLPWFVFVPFHPLPPTPFSLDDLVPVAVVGAGVVLTLWRGRPRLELVTGGLLLLAALNLLASLATLGDNGALLRSVARGAGRPLLYAGLIASVVWGVRGRRDADRMIRSIVVAAAAQGAFCFWAYLVDYTGPFGIGVAPTPAWSTVRRVHGTFAAWEPGETVPVSANFLSAYLLVGVLLGAGLWLRAETRRGRALWLGCVIAAAGGIGVSFTRASTIALGFGIVVLAVLTRRLAAVAVPLVLVALAFVTFDSFQPDLGRRLGSGGSDRPALYAAAVRVIGDHAAFGVGDGNYMKTVEATPRYRHTRYGEATSTPHNSVLLAAAHAGVPAGLVVLFLLAFGTLRAVLLALWSGEAGERAALASIAAAAAAFWLQDQSNNLLFVPKVATWYWLLVALSIVLGRHLRPPQARAGGGGHVPEPPGEQTCAA